MFRHVLREATRVNNNEIPNNAVQPIASICHFHVAHHADNLDQSEIQSGNGRNHSLGGS